MELRSYNVENIYKECVICTIKDSIGVNKEKILQHTEDIRSMLQQLPEYRTLNLCHIRTDGEVWTPYLQIVKMLILLGEKIGVVSFVPPLVETTLIKIDTLCGINAK